MYPMKRCHVICFILIFLANNILCSNGKLATEDLDKNSYKYIVAHEVFDDLIMAKGVRSMPKPAFILTKSMRNVAWSNYGKAEIGLEQRAYDVCISFGKDSLNALAAILAHELTHYYEKHGWTENFIAHSKQAIGPNDLILREDHTTMELEADYLGGFLAYSAGYNTLKMMPELLKKIYVEYDLPESLEGYPDLGERINYSRQALKKTEKLIDIFDFSNSLVGLAEFEKALSLYKYILKEYQSREIYNNMGVLCLSAFLKMSSSKELKFAFPFELDAKIRIERGQRGGHVDFGSLQNKRNELLMEAIDYFERANTLDENYAKGYFNLANAFVLNGSLDDAEYFLLKSARLSDKGDQAFLGKVDILKGIIYAHKNNVEKAEFYFKSSMLTNPLLSKMNIEMLTGTYSHEIKPQFSVGSDPEQIGNTQLDKYVNDLLRGRLEPDYIVEIDKKNSFGVLQKSHSTIFIYLSHIGDNYILLQQTKQAYEGLTQKKLGIGSDSDYVLEKYHRQDIRTNFSNGMRLTYFDDKIIFEINEKGLIKNWGLFRINSKS